MKQSSLAISISLILGSLLASQNIYANPNGAQVVQGTASFSNPSVNVLNINNSRNAILNWQSFNIGAGQTTNFIQPSSTSSVLNRVISNAPSNILGNLNSNGKVFLINQHGILVGEGANINTSGFFGSTLNITDADFLNGKLNFNGGGQGDLENQGYIHAGEDGSIVLIAPNIENGGVIEVENGNVILAAGKSISITSLENSSIQFEVTSAENQVTNLGQIIAKNGAASIFAGTLKHSGSIRASGLVQNADGSISLVATDRVEVSGSVDVSGEKGGYIEILADVVDINDGAMVNASGVSGGGEILIGGDQQGLNPDIKNSTSTTIDEKAEVHADATDSGDGGKVIVFAQNDVHVHGEITAKGGVKAGDGGFIETSGLRQLDITRAPDASAFNGTGGEWLIDPNNIDIVAFGADDPTYDGTSFTSSFDSTTLTASLIESALDLSINVTIITGDGGAQAGDINVNANIDTSASTPGNLTLIAHNNININADILSSFGSFTVNLLADSDSSGSGDVNLNNGIINTVFGDVNFSAININVTGIFTLENEGGNINFAGPLNIQPGATLNLGSSFSSGSTLTTTGLLITNDGNFNSNAGCGDGCGSNDIQNDFINNGVFRLTSGAASIDGVFTNNSIIDIAVDSFNFGQALYVGTTVAGTLQAMTGSTVTSVADGLLVIDSKGIFDLQAPLVLEPSMILELNEGKIENAQNLTIPDTFDVFGGTISGDGVFVTPALSTTTISGGATIGTTIQGVNAATPLDWINYGSILWNDLGSFPDITLNDAKIINQNEFYISLLFNATISDNGNSKIFNDVGALFGMGSSNATANINTVFENSGVMNIATFSDVLSLSGDLTLENGALLMGEGQLSLNGGAGTLTVNNGGGISPGNNDDGTLTIEGNLVVNPGANLLFDLESNFSSVFADKINVFSFINGQGKVTLNGGELFVLWEGAAGSSGFDNIASGSFFSLIECSSGPCLTEVIPLNIHDPVDVTGSTTSIFSSTSDTFNLSLGTKSGGTVYQWDGGGIDNNWSTAANWLGDVAPSLNTDSVIIDGNGSVIQVDITSPVTVAALQTDADVTVGAGGSLNLNGDGVITSTYVQNVGYTGLDFIAPTSELTGTGRLFTLAGTYNHFNDGNNVTISEWNNDGLLCLENTPTLIFDNSVFTNHGTLRFMQTNFADVQLLNGGLFHNNGLIVSNPNASDVTLSLSSHDPDGRIRIEQGTLFLNQSLLSEGAIDIGPAASLTLAAGTALTMGIGSSFSGFGSIDLPNSASILTINDSSVSVDPSLTMAFGAGSTLDQAQNLNVPDVISFTDSSIISATGFSFNIPFSSTVTLSGVNTLSGDMIVFGDLDWPSGVLQNSGPAFLITDSLSFVTLGAAGSTSINGVDWINDGHVDWVSADDFIINNATFTNTIFAFTSFNVATTSNNADITGNGTFINEGSFTINDSANAGPNPFATSTDLNIGATFNNVNDGISTAGLIDVTNPGFSLIFENNASFQGYIAVENSAQFILSAGNYNFADGFLVENLLGSPGNLTISGGVLAIDGGLSLATLNLSGGIIDINKLGVSATGNTLNANIINWSGNSIISGDTSGSPTGVLNIGSTDQLLLTGGSNHDFIGLNVTHDGQIDIASVADRLTLTGSQLNTNSTGSITGTGSVELQTGSLWDINSPSLVMPVAMRLDLAGGTLINAQNLTVPASFNWSSGIVSGTTATDFILPSGTSTTLGGAITLDMVNLLNEGDIVWSGAGGSIAINNGSQWFNQSQMTFLNNSLVDVTTNTPLLSLMSNQGGTILINSSSEVSMSAPFINYDIATAGSGGTLDLQQGILTLANALILDEGSSLHGGGTLNASLVVDSASVYPGNGLGMLTVNGDVTFNTGSELVVELDTGASDVLSATGNVTISADSSLSLVAINGYNGVYQETFSLIQSGGLTGTFTNLNQPADFKVSPAYGVTNLDLIVSSLLNNWTDSAGDSLWSTAANWSRGLPGLGHEIFINDGVSSVIHGSGDDTILSLTTNNGTILNLNGGSLTLETASEIGGELYITNAALTTNSSLNVQTLSLSNASLTGGNGNLNINNSLLVDNSIISSWSSMMASQIRVTGVSTYESIGNVAHIGSLDITNAADKLILLNTVMDSGSTSSLIGAGTLDLQTGSDWVINVASFFTMPTAMTLDLNGGILTNVEKLVFPGTVNAYQIDFVENGPIVIPDTTTFNYFMADHIAPGVQVVNNGNFVINSGASLNLDAQFGDAFVNNGIFNIASASTLNLLTELDSTFGEIIIAAGAVLTTEAGAILKIGTNNISGNSVSGNGILSINGGVMDVAAPAVLSNTVLLNLFSGSITNAQNLTIPGNFNWFSGNVDGTGTGFETTGQVSLESGTLSTDWLISSGTVDWVGSDFDTLVINDATITNQGVFTISILSNEAETITTNQAMKDFSSSTNAGFINQGILLIDAGDDTLVFDLNFDNDGGIIGIVSGIFSLAGNDLVLDQAGESLQGFGTFAGDVINTAGLVTPGRLDPEDIASETGTLTISGDYTQGQDGTMAIKLDSTLDGLKHDTLDVAGILTADGSIDFKIINGASIVQIAALLDTSFSPISFGTFAGKFAKASIPAGLNFTLGEGGVITITSDNPLLINVANQLEVLLSKENLDFSEMVQIMRFIDQRAARISTDEEEDERAPRLVCK